MPIYEYSCTDCNLKFELIRPLSQATAMATCPKCEKSADGILSNFVCFSSVQVVLPSAIGGNSCDGCSADSCDTCNI